MQKFNMPASASRTLPRVFLMALMAALTLLAACSSLRLAYNNGDTLLYWWLDGYVDLNAEQKDWVKKDIDKLFQWHRKTQLEDYIQILQTGQRQLAGNPGVDDLLGDFTEIRKRTERLLQQAKPELADLARSLQPEQIATLEKKFASNLDDFRKKNMKGDREAQQQFRYKKAMEQFELWFGRFNAEQEAQIRKASDARPLDNTIWLAERQRRQRAIVELVRKVQQEKLGKEATMALIDKLISDSFKRLDQSEHKQFFDASERGTAEMIVTVIRIATPQQKAHAQQRMQGWISDFQALAKDAR